MDLQRWVEELRRRRVFRALVGYGIAALVVLRASDSLLQAARLPGWILSVEVVVLGLGFPITVALVWVFDLTSGGVERTPAGSPSTRTAPLTRSPRSTPGAARRTAPSSGWREGARSATAGLEY